MGVSNDRRRGREERWRRRNVLKFNASEKIEDFGLRCGVIILARKEPT